MELNCLQLLDQARIGSFEMTLAGRLVDCNDACARILGFGSREDLLKAEVLPFRQDSDLEMILSSIGELNEVHGAEINMVRDDGAEIWTNQNLLLIPSSGPAEPKIVGTMIDVTEARTSIWDLEYHAQHDPITGLPNRAMLLEKAKVTVATASRTKDPIAVIIFEIDDFERIASEVGAGESERILREFSTRIYEQARASDLVGRYSEYQIAAVLNDFDEDVNALAMANRLLSAISKPIESARGSRSVTASAGVAMFPEDSQEAETLFELAVSATRRAHDSGGNTCRLYEQTRNDAAFERAFLISSVGASIEAGQFSLRYQPLVDVRTGRIECLETSVRWLHPRMGLLEPTHFMPLLDRLEASVRLGHWVVAEAARQIAEWKSMGLEVPRIAINLSTSQLEHPDLGRTLEKEVEAAKLSPELFQIEVPERVLCARPKTMMLTSELTERGFSVAIDDYGTGGCSVVDLKHLNAASLKIDRSFVRSLDNGRSEMGLIDGMITLGRAMGKEIIADGVGSRRQLMSLRSLDCALMQGDYLGVPLPAGETSDLLRMQH